MCEETVKPTWELIYFSRAQVVAESAKSIKLKFPDGCPMKDYTFWIAKKLVNDNHFASIKTDFKIKCSQDKFVDGKWIHEDEITLHGSTVVAYFEKWCEFYEQERIVEIIPDKLEPIKNAQPLDELMR